MDNLGWKHSFVTVHAYMINDAGSKWNQCWQARFKKAKPWYLNGPGTSESRVFHCGNTLDTSGLRDCFHCVLDGEESDSRQGWVFVKIRGVYSFNLFLFLSGGNIFDTSGLRNCFHCVFVKIRGVILPNLFSFFNCGNILDTYGLRDCFHCVQDGEVLDRFPAWLLVEVRRETNVF